MSLKINTYILKGFDNDQNEFIQTTFDYLSSVQKVLNNINIVDNSKAKLNLLYEDSLPLWEKIQTVATKIYGAKEIQASKKVKETLKKLQADYGELPICMAKTQMSFSTDATLRGAPTGHIVEITDVKLENGAGFIVAIAGDMMTMPGLPKVPTAEKIDIDDDGVITGLF